MKFMGDLSSSSPPSSDDSDVEEIILDDNVDNLVLLHFVEEFKTGPKKTDQNFTAYTLLHLPV